MPDALFYGLAFAHVLVAAGAIVFLAWLGPRAFRTPLWMPLLLICSGIASFALLDVAGELEFAQGKVLQNVEFDVAAQSGVILAIVGLVHLAAVYPRRLDDSRIRAGLLAFYAVALAGIFLAPLRVGLDTSLPGGGVLVAGPGLIGDARVLPMYTGLVATMVWFGYLGVRGRNERERKAGLNLCITVAATLTIAVTLPLSGLPISRADTTMLSVTAWLIGAGLALARGGLPMPAQASLRRFMESSRDALLFVDASTLIVSMNPVAVEILGAGGAWAGTPFEQVMRPAFKDEATWNVVSKSIGDALLAKSLKTEAEADRVGPQERPFRVVIDPMETNNKRGRSEGALVRMIDISNERAAEEGSRRAQALQDLVIRVMGHDLKTPIAVVGGYLQLAEMRLSKPMGDAEREATRGDLKKAGQATALMHVIMANARAISRLTMGVAPETRQEVDLAKMVREVTEILGPLATAKLLTLEVDCPESLRLPLLPGFESVIMNLTSNAIKYTPDGGKVTVALRDAGGATSLEVEDTGPGIPVEARRHLFQEYERLSREQTVGSHGLGLSIASTLVELDGGRISVHDRPDGKSGTLFRVEFAAASKASKP
jgi:signal transduction histidine kinase